VSPVPVILTIAGSDSGGGAGVQADIKTFYAMGVHGTSVITSITAQNSLGVIDRFDLQAAWVASQLEAILADFDVAAIKTGMLGNSRIAKRVAGILEKHACCNLVVDPVIVSSSGQALLDERGRPSIIEHLLPLATLLTPNLSEASALTGITVNDIAGMREAAITLRKMGPAAVVVTGGHLHAGDVTDVFYDGDRVIELTGRRVESGNDHGTGCVFSAAVAVRLGTGQDVLAAVESARQDVAEALANSVSVGHGRGVVRPVCRPL
jgi:hydroxymethylpyrimidine kinase/phosphomethylpyrimidine kinase